MSYSTFLESQNKNLRDSAYGWQKIAYQYSVVINAKNQRIADLEKQISLRDGLLDEEYALRKDLAEECRNLTKERDMWKSNHDNQKTLKSQLMDRPDLKDRAQSIWKLYKRIAELEGKTDFPDWNQWFKENLQQNK